MTKHWSALYNFFANSLSEPSPHSASQPKRRRWSIIASGLLLLALALVVLYTSRSAFSSPLAMVVVAAIGFAALLAQLRLRKDANAVRSPFWLNVVAIIFALIAVFADALHLNTSVMLLAALGAIICFAISGFVVLRALRK